MLIRRPFFRLHKSEFSSLASFYFARGFEAFFSIFGLACACVASIVVASNSIYLLLDYQHTTATYLLVFGVVAAFLPRPWGLMGIVLALPLTSNLHTQLSAAFGIQFVAFTHVSFDLVAGFILGSILCWLWDLIVKKSSLATFFAAFLKGPLPWPVGLVLFIITLSVMLAIARNLHLSATHSSIDGLLFNLREFRPVEWRADFLPLLDWLAYSLSVGLIFLVLENLRAFPLLARNAIIFRALLIGITLAAMMGLIQSATGFGLPEAALAFRKDNFGFMALGFQPDLHAFSAQMLLGVVGLWGYWKYCSSPWERTICLVVIALSAAGLLASKSRASLGFALLALILILIFFLGRHFFANKSRQPVWLQSTIFSLFGMAAVGMTLFWIISELGWADELILQFQTRDLSMLSNWSGILGSRIEIWSAVRNMVEAFPVMGVGQGEFYRLSSNVSFSKSYFLELNGGEHAHNYFLQTLAETGLLGVSAFGFALAYPYFASSNRRLLTPAIFALGSLFLGNIFAHAFLVRENLFIGAVLVGLLYALSNAYSLEEKQGGVIGFIKPKIILSLFCVLGLLALIEVLPSFNRKPFLYGLDCFMVEKPLFADGWSSGRWEARIPKDQHGVTFKVDPSRTNLERHPLTATFELLSWEPGKGKVPILTEVQQWQRNEARTVSLAIPKSYWNSPFLISARMTLSSCYTPRDLGLSADSRRLGVRMTPPEFWQTP